MNEVVISEGGVSLHLDPVELEALMRLSTMLPGSLAQKLTMAETAGSKAPATSHGVSASMSFKLPEDQDSLEDALHATDMRCLFYNIFRDARAAIRHGAPFLGTVLSATEGGEIPDASEKTLDALTSYLRREFAERGIRWQD